MILLRLCAACPRCNRRPNVRATPKMLELARALEPEEPLHSIQCTRDGCETIYLLAAVAYQRAEVERQRAA